MIFYLRKPITLYLLFYYLMNLHKFIEICISVYFWAQEKVLVVRCLIKRGRQYIPWVNSVNQINGFWQISNFLESGSRQKRPFFMTNHNFHWRYCVLNLHCCTILNTIIVYKLIIIPFPIWRWGSEEDFCQIWPCEHCGASFYTGLTWKVDYWRSLEVVSRDN